MKIIVTKDYNDLSAQVADLVIKQIKLKPDSVLGLPTGGTPLGLYHNLIKAYQQGIISFSRVTTFNLDEYLGLGCGDKQSYCYFMWHNLFKEIDIKKENVFIPNGLVAKVKAGNYCRQYEEEIINRGGLDLQILGIGQNGHLGFNEPGSAIESEMRIVNLSDNTIEANSRFFSNPKIVPTKAITLGLEAIMAAKKIIVLAAGQPKAEAIAKAISGPVSQELPASVLQQHNNVTFVLDRPAASQLN
ncbi:MAG: glucosamine-6-phosphate deaminase [Candidatus Buchananbacteria bacterium]|jgi:glucosamine-6-phosphate deaminase